MKLRAALALGFVLSLSSLALADVGPPPDLAKQGSADMASSSTPKEEGCNMAGGTAGGAAVLALVGLFAARRRR